MSSMDSRDVQIALIGYGLAGSVFHAPLISTTPGMQLAAIVTGNQDRVDLARRMHPGADVFATPEQLWDKGGVDCVVIATPNITHAPLALAAISHGVAVVVDKPLAISSEQADQVIKAADDAGVLLTVFQNRRWDGDFLTVKSLLESGALGRIARFESRFERWRPQIKDGWRENVSPSDGGGLLFDLGSHVIDQALTLFGPAASVYAEVDTTRPDAKVDDDVFVAITHHNGVRSHLFASATAADLGPKFRVLGREGGYSCYGLDVQENALRAGLLPGDGWGAVDEKNWGELTNLEGVTAPFPTIPGDYPEFYRELRDAIRGDGPVPVDPRGAADTLRIIEAARYSSTMHRVVTL